MYFFNQLASKMRGWVFYSNGPAIDLADPIYLETLGR